MTAPLTAWYDLYAKAVCVVIDLLKSTFSVTATEIAEERFPFNLVSFFRVKLQHIETHHGKFATQKLDRFDS